MANSIAKKKQTSDCAPAGWPAIISGCVNAHRDESTSLKKNEFFPPDNSIDEMERNAIQFVNRILQEIFDVFDATFLHFHFDCETRAFVYIVPRSTNGRDAVPYH